MLSVAIHGHLLAIRTAWMCALASRPRSCSGLCQTCVVVTAHAKRTKHRLRQRADARMTAGHPPDIAKWTGPGRLLLWRARRDPNTCHRPSSARVWKSSWRRSEPRSREAGHGSVLCTCCSATGCNRCPVKDNGPGHGSGHPPRYWPASRDRRGRRGAGAMAGTSSARGGSPACCEPSAQ